MPTRQRAAARKRAPVRRRRPRRLDPKAAAERASRLPHHPRYTAALLAQVRQRYEDTPEPIPSMAADLGVAPQSLHRIARRHGWVRRNPVPPARDLSRALRILQEAQALAAADGAVSASSAVARDDATSRPPLEKGRSTREARRVGIAEGQEVIPTRRPAAADLALSGGGPAAEPPSTTAGTEPAAPPAPSVLDRLERAVVAELATIEAMRAALGIMPQKPPAARETMRTLSMLTQTLQLIQRMRASAALEAQNNPRDDRHDDDDLPADIDEFRRELARRIDAFVASRTGGGGARADDSADAVDAPSS